MRVLENGAKILYYCDERAVQSVSEKYQLLDDVSYHWTASCDPTYIKKARILQPLLCVRATHVLRKQP